MLPIVGSLLARCGSVTVGGCSLLGVGVGLMGVGNRLRLRITLQFVPSCVGRGSSQLAAAGGEWRPRLLNVRVGWGPHAELDASEGCLCYPQRVQIQTIANQDPDSLVLIPSSLQCGLGCAACTRSTDGERGERQLAAGAVDHPTAQDANCADNLTAARSWCRAVRLAVTR